jgi:predicted secreted protein
MQVFTYNDNGKTAHVKFGEPFEVHLGGRRISGHRWLPDAESFDKLACEEIAPITDGQTPQRPGAGSVQVWRLRAESSGATEIGWTCRRPWENPPKGDSLRFTLRVEIT